MSSGQSQTPDNRSHLLGSFLLEQTARAMEDEPESFRQVLDQAGGLAWDPDELQSLLLARESPAALWEKVRAANPNLSPEKVFSLSPMEAATSVLRSFPNLDQATL